MPIYDYLCKTCGPFEQRRPMAESNALAPCPLCGIPASRMLTATQLNLMSSTDRIAQARNEKSAHAPDIVHTLRPQGADGAHSRTEHQHHGHGHQKPPPARPWMIGH